MASYGIWHFFILRLTNSLFSVYEIIVSRCERIVWSSERESLFDMTYQTLIKKKQHAIVANWNYNVSRRLIPVCFVDQRIVRLRLPKKINIIAFIACVSYKKKKENDFFLITNS
jgi:hypothetical protein